jgi:hypothetical protein
MKSCHSCDKADVCLFYDKQCKDTFVRLYLKPERYFQTIAEMCSQYSPCKDAKTPDNNIAFIDEDEI